MAQLSASGEDVVGRIRCPQFLLLARTLLLGMPGTGLPWNWWALRTVAVQQRILSSPAASLQTEIEQLTELVWPYTPVKVLAYSIPLLAAPGQNPVLVDAGRLPALAAVGG